jgi:hypothetical protein
MDAKNSTHFSDHSQVLPVLNSTPVSTSWLNPDPPIYYDQKSDSNHGPPSTSTASSASPSAPDNSHAFSFIDESSRRDQTLRSSEPSSQDVGKSAVTKPRKPRKPSNASGGRSTLFWVNTEPNSAAKGTKEETLKRIRSHVMSEHNRKKRLESTKRHKSKTWKHLAFQPPETTASSSSAAPPLVPAPDFSRQPSIKASQWDHKVSSGPSTTYYAPECGIPGNAFVGNAPGFMSVSPEDYSDNDASSHAQALALVQTVSPLTYVGPGGNDPFNVFHTRLTDRMSRHLHQCELTPPKFT